MTLTLARCATLAACLFAATMAAQTATTAHTAATCTVTIHVDGFRNDKGDAGLSVFKSSDGWPNDNDKAFQHGPRPITGSTATITLQLPAGRYAFAMLHDENSNHKMDRNMFGIPKEGFGFSNNPKVFLTPPSFDTAAITVACPSTEVTIHLAYK